MAAQILQIIPAQPGWWVELHDDARPRLRVVCWALIADRNERNVVAMYPNANGSSLTASRDDEAFASVVWGSDPEDGAGREMRTRAAVGAPR